MRSQTQQSSATPRRMCALALMLLSLVFVSGCGPTKTIIQRPGDVSLNRKVIPNWPLWSFDKNGKLIESTGDIPVGAPIQVPETEIRLPK